MGVFWFALVFLVEPWNRLAPGELSRFALARRRQLGLAFGFHHFVHLGILLAFLHVSGRELNLARASGGMIGYLFLAAMMLTSTNAAVRRLGARNWKRLHRTGLWVLWLIFVLTYLPRLQGKLAGAGGSMREFVACTIVLAFIALVRSLTFFSTRATAHVR